MKAPTGKTPVRRASRRRRRVPDAEVVRRAVSGTLNREVQVEVEVCREPADRWEVTLLAYGRRAPSIFLKRWEMEAMRQVPLVPAHLRGHFLRNYAALERAGRPQE